MATYYISSVAGAGGLNNGSITDPWISVKDAVASGVFADNDIIKVYNNHVEPDPAATLNVGTAQRVELVGTDTSGNPLTSGYANIDIGATAGWNRQLNINTDWLYYRINFVGAKVLVNTITSNNAAIPLKNCRVANDASSGSYFSFTKNKEAFVDTEIDFSYIAYFRSCIEAYFENCPFTGSATAIFGGANNDVGNIILEGCDLSGLTAAAPKLVNGSGALILRAYNTKFPSAIVMSDGLYSKGFVETYGCLFGSVLKDIYVESIANTGTHIESNKTVYAGSNNASVLCNLVSQDPHDPITANIYSKVVDLSGGATGTKFEFELLQDNTDAAALTDKDIILELRTTDASGNAVFARSKETARFIYDNPGTALPAGAGIGAWTNPPANWNSRKVSVTVPTQSGATAQDVTIRVYTSGSFNYYIDLTPTITQV